jgi:hypothetical protein
MQTKFKWTDKQRLLLISGLSMGISLSPSIEMSQRLSEDIYYFTKASADQINTDERIQKKLKYIFELQITLGPNNLYEQFLKLEKETGEDDQVSLSA